MLSDIPSQILKSPGRYAVLLNARAKRWTGDLHADIQRWVSPKDLYLTDDFNQAERTLDRLVKDGYDFIFTGGGDGTISYLINAVERRVRDGMVKRDQAPGVGVLRMGTGNALASYVESGDIVDDLRRLREGAPLVVYDVNMVECEEGLFPFVGFGWDGLILNDYDALKDAVRGSAAENYVTGLGGYALSIGTRSIPNALKVGAVPLVLTALDHCVEIDHDGRELAEFHAGDIMVDRDAKVCGCGTIPYWGFKVKMFPHCTQRPGYFELRVYWGSVGWILKNLPDFWDGELEPGMYRNFLCKHVRCEFPERALAYQVGGDAKGFEKLVEWKTSEFPAKLAVPLR
ncbi:MAG: diacylglycerol kinase family protein [bacterium]